MAGTGAGDADHLDELIGEIRREAARRRAAPDFPVDEEARIGVELDSLGPRGSAADLAEVLAALRSIAAGRPPYGPANGGADRRYQEIADLTASAVQALAARLDQLERHRPADRDPRPPEP